MLMTPPPATGPANTAPPFLNRQAPQLLAAQPGIGGMRVPSSIYGGANSLGPQQPQMMALLRALQLGGNKAGVM